MFGRKLCCLELACNTHNQTAVSISIACARDRFSRGIVVHRFVSRCPWPGSLIIPNEVPVYARVKILREYSRHVNEKQSSFSFFFIVPYVGKSILRFLVGGSTQKRKLRGRGYVGDKLTTMTIFISVIVSGVHAAYNWYVIFLFFFFSFSFFVFFVQNNLHVPQSPLKLCEFHKSFR